MVTYESLIGDLRDLLVSHVATFGYVIDAATPPDVALNMYINLCRRRISAAKRTPLRSRELAARRLPTPIENVLQAIETASALGEDLNPFLHRALRETPDYDDRLLNDWGLHHLHLGSVAASPKTGLSTRSKEVLLALVRAQHLYLIDVRPHGKAHPEWTVDRELIEIAHENWPDVLSEYRMDHVLEAEDWSDAGRATMRKLGLTTLITMPDGVVYAPPGGGMMQSGLSTIVRRHSDCIRTLVRDLAELAQGNASLGEAVARRGAAFKLSLTFTGFGLDLTTVALVEPALRLRSTPRWN